MLRRFMGTLGEREQVEVDLDRRGANQIIHGAAPVEDSWIVRADQLNVRAARLLPEIHLVSQLMGVAIDVDAHESELREPV